MSQADQKTVERGTTWIPMFRALTGEPIRKRCWCGQWAAWWEDGKPVCYTHRERLPS